MERPMRFARFTVGRLMRIVGLAALNLGAARGLAAYDDTLMLGVMPTAIMLQLALLRLIRTKGTRRAFWAGFLATGVLATLSFAGANRFSWSKVIELNPVTGSFDVVANPGSYGGDRML